MKRLVVMVVLLANVAFAGGKKAAKSDLSPLTDYLAQFPETAETQTPSGSLWRASSSFSSLSSDYKAEQVNDLITIRIMEQVSAQSAADVTSQRKFQAQSGLSALAGKINTSGLQSLFSPSSDSELTGKGSATSKSSLQTSLAGRVVAVLPNGTLVVEAERSVHMNNETQTIVLRGMVRPADVLADNSVYSTSLANLQLELKGKGIISDSTRPPNRLVRAILWLVGF